MAHSTVIAIIIENIIRLHKLKRPSDIVLHAFSFVFLPYTCSMLNCNKSCISNDENFLLQERNEWQREYRLLLLGRRKTDMSLIIQMK